MTYRSRLLIALLAAALIPIAVLTFLIRDEVTTRLTADYTQRAEAAIAMTEATLRKERDRIRSVLAALTRSIADDNRFRRAAVDNSRNGRTYLLDYAGSAMRLNGLAMLQIQDEIGRILSSGHFRNEFDRIDTSLRDLLPREGLALALVRAPEGPFTVLVARDSITMGGRIFHIAGGERIDKILPEEAQHESDPVVTFVTFASDTRETDGTSESHEVSTDGPRDLEIVRELQVPLIDTRNNTVSMAAFRISHSLQGLNRLRAGIDRRSLIVLLLTGMVAALAAFWLAGRMSRPITELAEKASRVDLDRLNIGFKTDRGDEIGALSRTLRSMTERLRMSASSIRDAERRATRGELARQVNHDIKNGLAPVRNVFRHLGEVAQTDPDRLLSVFRDRQATLESGIAYLETLATNYARLYPAVVLQRTDVNAVVERVTRDLASTGNLSSNTTGALYVRADPVAVRRLLENLIGNAIDSTRSNGGSVNVSTSREEGENGHPVVRIVVQDSGEGMTEDEISQAFQDFFTTREQGTGLGLTIVRRLVTDMEGTVRVESRKGEGSRFVVDLPELKGG